MKAQKPCQLKFNNLQGMQIRQTWNVSDLLLDYLKPSEKTSHSSNNILASFPAGRMRLALLANGQLFPMQDVS